MADNFDEKSGLVFNKTPWGQWGQTIEDIHILINVQRGTNPKSIKCIIEPRRIKISVAERTIVEVSYKSSTSVSLPRLLASLFTLK